MSVFTENYFANCETLDETKLLWKQLAKKYHPDRFAANNITSEEQKKEYEQTMQDINLQYQWQVAYIKEQLDPNASESGTGGFIFKVTMKFMRRIYFYKLSREFKIDRNLCRYMNIYLFDFGKTYETGAMHCVIDIKPETVQSLIDLNLAKVNKLNFVVTQHTLDKGDLKTLKQYIPRLKVQGNFEIPDEAKNIAILGDFVNWNVTIVIDREGKPQLRRTFPEKKNKLLQPEKQQLAEGGK